jgi:hypothetical protein
LLFARAERLWAEDSKAEAFGGTHTGKEQAVGILSFQQGSESLGGCVVDDHSFERRALSEKFEVFRRCAKLHDPFDPGAVVARAIEEDHFTLRRQMFDVALKLPLPGFPLGRLLQGDDVGSAGVEVLHEPLDRSSLGCGVASLEMDQDSLPSRLHPLLNLEQFGLQSELYPLIFGSRHLIFVGIDPFSRGDFEGYLIAEAF